MLLKRIKYQTKEIINPDNLKNIPDNFFSKYFSFRSNFARRLYLFVLTFAVIVGILSYNFTPDLGIKPGEASPKTIKANKSIGFEDTVKTEEDRNRREIEVEDVYIYDTQVLNGTEGVLYQIRYFFQLVKIVSKKDFGTIEEKVDYLSNLTQNEYSGENLKTALLLDYE
jgi:membrane-associated HD superfamily phosphohydrolase